eukprot:10321608-Alexandrium_andersonii.AAC.1
MARAWPGEDLDPDEGPQGPGGRAASTRAPRHSLLDALEPPSRAARGSKGSGRPESPAGRPLFRGRP